MDEKRLTRVLILSGLLGFLVLSFLFDFAANIIEMQAIQGAGFQPLLVVLLPVFQLLVVLGGLGLFRYLITSPERNRLESWIFAVVGLLLVFFEPLLFFLPIPITYYALAQFVSPGTYLFLAGSLIGMIGVINLALKRA
jgi:hypothetical protein